MTLTSCYSVKKKKPPLFLTSNKKNSQSWQLTLESQACAFEITQIQGSRGRRCGSDWLTFLSGLATVGTTSPRGNAAKLHLYLFPPLKKFVFIFSSFISFQLSEDACFLPCTFLLTVLGVLGFDIVSASGFAFKFYFILPLPYSSFLCALL